ncbi:MAG: SDR family NAD(P)-dependent oxidoreductase, partial [Chloroflexales bacterium]|nr:SDR family NAD(P)-dependent oxidoreductase [Chloroflexales bacterium]
LLGLARPLLADPAPRLIPSLQQGRDERGQIMSSLAALYVGGAAIRWEQVYADEPRRRVALPTYPFERQRFWVERGGQPAWSERASGAPVKLADLARWSYTPSWKRTPLPVAPSSAKADESGEPWLIFLDDLGIGAQLAAQLSAGGVPVVTVRRARAFGRLGPGDYALHPERREDYEALLSELARERLLPRHIAHLWAAGPDVGDGDTGLAGRHFFSLLYLAQALSAQRPGGAANIHLLTRGLYEVTGGEELAPEKAALLGLARVVPQEYAGLRCRIIDIDLAELPARGLEALTARLSAELAAQTADSAIAYRGPFRWAQRYEPAPLPEPESALAALPKDGVYLITGGLGGVAFELAQHLARAGGARLVLTGREAMPARELWPGWLEQHGPADRLSQRIRRVESLEALGAEVWPVAADVAHEPAMRDLLGQIERRFGRLDGVIHAAGVLALTPIGSLGAAEWQEQYRPKVRGLQVLDKLLAGRQLSLCLLTSSLSSILGGLGLGAYAAANAYLDAFAHQSRRRGGLPWVSVNWDSWRLPDGREQGTELSAMLAEMSMSPEEGVELFRRIAGARDEPQIIVSVGDLQARLSRWVSPERAPAPAAGHPAARPGPAKPRPLRSGAYVAPESEVQRRIAAIWEDLLGVAPVGLHDSFFELGGDSLLATQVISHIRQAYQVELSVRTLFEALTVGSLAEHLETALWAAQAPMARAVGDAGDREEVEI